MLKKIRVLVVFMVVTAMLVSLGGIASAAGDDRATWRAFPQCKQGAASATFTKVIQVMLANYNDYTNSQIMDYGGVDGIFGSHTKEAVIAFQNDNGLSGDGIVGPNTWGKFYDRISCIGGWVGGTGGVDSGLNLYIMDNGYSESIIIGYCAGTYSYFEGYPTHSWWVDVSGGGMEGTVIMFKS